MENYQELRRPIGALLHQCDGAVTLDDTGFNKVDSPFARSLYNQCFWTHRQAQAAYKMLIKYKGQLSDLGFSISPPAEEPRSPGNPSPSEKTLKIEGTEARVIFRCGREEFQSILSAVRTIPGRKFDAGSKTWTVPVNDYSMSVLEGLGFDVPKKEEVEKEIQLPTGLSYMPFQLEGISRLVQMDGRGLLADEMGCGKTIQALGYMTIKKEQRPALIIVPASLKINWERELKKWLPGEKAKIINGRSDSLGDNISIINYDILKDYVQKAKDVGVQLIVLDECHMTKNRKAQRTKAVREVCRGVSHVIALSGTPITNRPAEFFNILSILNPQMFGSFWHYAQEYCGAVQGRFGWDFSGATNTERLHQILTKTLMIRRLKKDVLAQLPKKRRSIIPLEINNRKEYNSAREDIISWLTDTEGEAAGRKASQAETLVRIERLKQLAFEGKVQSALEWIENFLEQEDKLVVFATHHKAIDVLMEKFQGIAVKVDGRDTQEARQNAVDEFQNNADIKLFIGNIKAAGVGLTLTAASSTAFIEFGWTPGDHDQAEDRVHRIGQEAESVNAYYLVGVDTIDEDICSLIDHKRKILDSVLDGHDTEEEALLTELIKELKRKAA